MVPHLLGLWRDAWGHRRLFSFSLDLSLPLVLPGQLATLFLGPLAPF